MARNQLLSVCLFACLLGGGIAAQGEKPVAPRPVTIGFVDLQKVFTEHPLVKDAMDEARREQIAKLEVLRQKDEKRKSLTQDLDILPKGSRAWLNVAKQIEILEKSIDIESELSVVEYQMRVVGAMKQVYKGVAKAVKQVAEKRGFDIVLNRTARDVGGKTRGEFLDRLSMRDVLYARPELDLTKEVLATFAAEKPAGKSAGSNGGSDGR